VIAAVTLVDAGLAHRGGLDDHSERIKLDRRPVEVRTGHQHRSQNAIVVAALDDRPGGVALADGHAIAQRILGLLHEQGIRVVAQEVMLAERIDRLDRQIELRGIGTIRSGDLDRRIDERDRISSWLAVVPCPDHVPGMPETRSVTDRCERPGTTDANRGSSRRMSIKRSIGPTSGWS
jgi:hypothetical protein